MDGMERKKYRISYSYDSLNRLAAVGHDGKARKYYGYDGAGNLVRISSTAPGKGEVPAGAARPSGGPPAAGDAGERRFALLAEEYRRLNDLARAGAISPGEFQEKVNALRFQDAAGAWWQLRYDGAWLRWEGAAWVEAKPGIQG